MAGTAMVPGQLFAGPKPGTILGIQLYSVRDDMNTDSAGTLKQLAYMGYKYVEHASYTDRKLYGYTAVEFKKRLDDLALKMPSGHTKLTQAHWDASKKDFTDEWKYTVEDAAFLGQQLVISPWMETEVRQTYDQAVKYMEIFNKAGELCKKSGMKFGYHNHDFEFNTMLNDVALYDIILTNTDPSLVAQQLDIGNMIGGGAKAMDVLKKYPGRFESLHVKDEIKSSQSPDGIESTILGKGIAGTHEAIVLAAKSRPSLHLIVEQESYQGKTPLACAKENLEIMKKWGV